MPTINGSSGNNALTGTASADDIYGNGGNDTINAGGGNDTVFGGSGNDTVNAGDGNDLIRGDLNAPGTWRMQVYDYNFSSANGQAPIIQTGTLRMDGLTNSFNVEEHAAAARGVTPGNLNDYGIIYTSTFTATVAGAYTFSTTSDDGSTLRLTDSTGNPRPWSGGNTFLNNDFHQSPTTRTETVQLAAGQTYTIEIRFWENAGGTALSATVAPPGGGTVNLLGSPYIGAPPFTGVEGNDSLIGGNGDDTIYGDGGNDTLVGGNNNDSVFGGTGNDSLLGDSGNDTLFGGDGSDTLDGGTGNDSLVGDAGADQLFGGAGADRLFGGAGNDTLTGGDGPDTMSGGDDRDLFFGTIGDVVYGGSTGDDYDTLDLTAFGKALTNIIYDPGNPENGTVEFLDGTGAVIGTMTFTDIEQVIPCFTPGTLITTPKGQRAVEDLAAGDLVMTRDSGMQALAWIGRRDLGLAQVLVNTALRPVTIAAGALGGGMPQRALQVSPQHRMLIEGALPEMLFGEAEVLVAALHLVGMPGITQDLTQGISYIHLMCGQHEIICAEGAWTESFQPGGGTLAAMATAQRDEVLMLFPELADGALTYPSARPTLRGYEARLLHAA